MNKKLSLLFLPLLGQTLGLHAADIDYTPLRLSGFNADVVLQPGERVVNTADGHWNFYSEALKGRGGLPQMLHGMFTEHRTATCCNDRFLSLYACIHFILRL